MGCTCIGLRFLMFCRLENNPRHIDIDEILIDGDRMYQSQIERLKKSGRFRNMLLSLDEIPNEVVCQRKMYDVIKEDIFVGQIVSGTTSELPSLQLALATGFQQSSSVLVMIGAICSAVHLNNDAFYFFDSHSHDDSGLFDSSQESGKSIVIGFSSLDDLVQYLYSFYTSMHIDLRMQFEVQPLLFIERNAQSAQDKNMENYFNYQKTRKDEVIKQNNSGPVRNSSEYMKEYMRVRRSNPALRKA